LDPGVRRHGLDAAAFRHRGALRIVVIALEREPVKPQREAEIVGERIAAAQLVFAAQRGLGLQRDFFFAELAIVGAGAGRPREQDDYGANHESIVTCSACGCTISATPMPAAAARPWGSRG